MTNDTKAFREALLPCPFCGANAQLTMQQDFVRCSNSGCFMIMNAIHPNDWNNRAAHDKTQVDETVPEDFYSIECKEIPSLGVAHEIIRNWFPDGKSRANAIRLVQIMQLNAVYNAPHNRTSAALSLLEKFRKNGWMVAVHNDYLQNGEFHTFWLFTKGNQCVKGEGKSDYEALAGIETQIGDNNDQ